MGVPLADVALDQAQLKRLLASQAPAFAHLPLHLESSGWDNFMYRLGAEHLVRLPRRQAAAALVSHEQRWLPLLAPRLPLQVPVPLHRGIAGEGYPYPWSICPWIEGASADLDPPRADEASALAAFLKALHQPAPPEAPINPYRGVPLNERRAKFEEVALRLEGRERVTRRHRELFEAGEAAPLDMNSCWIHGDLHPGNMLTRNGRLSGVIDWGDLAQGDPATDLSAVFLLFADARAQERFGRDYPATSATWIRARAWAVLFAAIFADAGQRGDVRMGPIGERVLRELT